LYQILIQRYSLKQYNMQYIVASLSLLFNGTDDGHYTVTLVMIRTVFAMLSFGQFVSVEDLTKNIQIHGHYLEN